MMSGWFNNFDVQNWQGQLTNITQQILNEVAPPPPPNGSVVSPSKKHPPFSDSDAARNYANRKQRSSGPPSPTETSTEQPPPNSTISTADRVKRRHLSPVSPVSSSSFHVPEASAVLPSSTAFVPTSSNEQLLSSTASFLPLAQPTISVNVNLTEAPLVDMNANFSTVDDGFQNLNIGRPSAGVPANLAQIDDGFQDLNIGGSVPTTLAQSNDVFQNLNIGGPSVDVPTELAQIDDGFQNLNIAGPSTSMKSDFANVDGGFQGLNVAELTAVNGNGLPTLMDSNHANLAAFGMPSTLESAKPPIDHQQIPTLTPHPKNDQKIETVAKVEKSIVGQDQGWDISYGDTSFEDSVHQPAEIKTMNVSLSPSSLSNLIQPNVRSSPKIPNVEVSPTLSANSMHSNVITDSTAITLSKQSSKADLTVAGTALPTIPSKPISESKQSLTKLDMSTSQPKKASSMLPMRTNQPKTVSPTEPSKSLSKSPVLANDVKSRYLIL
jgi:hypothetical protein